MTSSADVTKAHEARPEPPMATHDGLVDAVVQLSFAVQFVLVEVGAAHGLSVTQLRLLGILRDRILSMSDIAGYLRLDRSSVTGLVGRAEERGLVRRERRTEDGRGVQVLSTARGQELAAQVHAEVADRLSGLTRMLSPSERARMTALIDRMVSVG